MKKLFIAISIIMGLFIILLSFNYINSNQVELPQQYPYQVKQAFMPGKVYFAGEQVPIENFDTYESLDKELHINTYWQSQTILLIKKANRYFPIIEPILKEEGVPDDFKYLAVAESGLANVVSPSKAVGFWQILEGTAKDYGLEVNEEVDERYHLEKATRAAAKYLKESYEKYGNWSMAAASYNMGRKNLSEQIGKQKSNNYYDLVLGVETGRYVYRIIALKIVLESPETYGFFISDSQKYQQLEYRIVSVDSSINHWADFAHNNGINYKTLKALNPWLRKNSLTNKEKKHYNIKIVDKNHRAIKPDLYFYPEE